MTAPTLCPCESVGVVARPGSTVTGMATARKSPAKKPPAKPATIMIKSAGGIRHCYEQGRQITLGPDPVEVPVHVGEAIIARGKAVKA